MTIATQVTKAVESYLNTKLTITTTTEYFDGGFEDLIVRKTPIVSVTSIEDMSSSATVTATTYGFYTAQGFIYYKNEEEWDEGRQKWKVIYTCGYTSTAIPADIQLAMDKWVAFLTAEPTGAVQSWSLGDYSETFVDIGNMPRQVKALLDPYKRRTF
jgi:hypothetical protein